MDRRTFIGTSIAAAGAASVAGTATHLSAAAKKAVENKPVILECAINGGTTKAKNPHAPGTLAEHTAEVIQCLDAGATIIHMHSNQPNEDVKLAAQPYIDIYTGPSGRSIQMRSCTRPQTSIRRFTTASEGVGWKSTVRSPTHIWLRPESSIWCCSTRVSFPSVSTTKKVCPARIPPFGGTAFGQTTCATYNKSVKTSVPAPRSRYSSPAG